MSSNSIKQTNRGLARFYANMGVKDYNDKLIDWCEENDYDTESLADDLNQRPKDSVVVEFDDNFPLPMQDDQKDEDKLRKIYEIIKNCWDNADAYLDDHRTISSVTKLCDPANFKPSNQQKQQYQQLYANQCPAIYHSGTKKDDAFLTALIVGRLHGVEYLQHLFDIYMRASVREFKDKDAVLQIENWAKQYPYFSKLNKTTADIAKGATKSFGARICPHLLFNTTTRIQDSLDETIKYIWLAVTFVQKLANKEEQNTCPFQMEVCIAFPKTKSSQLVVDLKGQNNANDDDDDDDDDDAVNYGTQEDEKSSGVFYDCIGDISAKLKSNKLPYVSVPVPTTAEEKETRIISTIYDTFSKKFGGDFYPVRKRFVTVIDRRKEEDEIIMYEPPRAVRDIPHNAVPEWYLNASKTCILPNIGYEPKIEKQENEAKKVKEEGNNFNINSLSSCGGALLTLSFHVKQSDSIKCYLYLNGQICRFFGEDLLDILPLFFDMEFGTNPMFVSDANTNDWTDDMKMDMKATKQLIADITNALVDREFNSFKRVWERDI